MITGVQILCHLIGDYVLQTDQMAAEKGQRFLIALFHALVYSIPFVLFAVFFPQFLAMSIEAFLVVVGTHAVIDHFKVARYIVWAKNQFAPKRYRYTFAEADWHGYKKDRPVWLAGWLLIIADNTLHLAINGFALEYL